MSTEILSFIRKENKTFINARKLIAQEDGRSDIWVYFKTDDWDVEKYGDPINYRDNFANNLILHLEELGHEIEVYGWGFGDDPSGNGTNMDFSMFVDDVIPVMKEVIKYSIENLDEDMLQRGELSVNDVDNFYFKVPLRVKDHKFLS